VDEHISNYWYSQ